MFLSKTSKTVASLIFDTDEGSVTFESILFAMATSDHGHRLVTTGHNDKDFGISKCLHS